jgi:uncharacterized membrane protein YgdD (TMEM256/DUF423 family)
MNNLKMILIVLGVVVLAALACGALTSRLMQDTSEVIDSASMLKAQENIGYMAKTIDKQATGQLIMIVVVALLVLGVMAFGGKILGLVVSTVQNGAGIAAQSGDASWGTNRRWLDAGGMPKYISLGPDAWSRIKALPRPKKVQLYKVLSTILSYLDEELGYNQLRADRNKDLALYGQEVESLPVRWEG